MFEHLRFQGLPALVAEQQRPLPGFDQPHVIRQHPIRARMVELALQTLQIKPAVTVGQQHRHDIFQASSRQQRL
ncbi:hypothetical protein D3C84_563150 [compost metagenome]